MTPDNSPTATPRDAVTPTVDEPVVIEGRTFLIRRPAEPDRVLDHPAVQATMRDREYAPYWIDLWPAARMLAKVILRETWPPGTQALELGCGLGLPGVAALAMGLHVTFSDYDPTALEFAADSARLNGFTIFRLLRLDWNDPPATTFPVILASDLIYEARNVPPVVAVLGRLLAPGGVCLLTDQDRAPAALMRETLTAAGFTFTTELVRAGQPGGVRVKGTLYRIRRH